MNCRESRGDRLIFQVGSPRIYLQYHLSTHRSRQLLFSDQASISPGPAGRAPNLQSYTFCVTYYKLRCSAQKDSSAIESLLVPKLPPTRLRGQIKAKWS